MFRIVNGLLLALALFFTAATIIAAVNCKPRAIPRITEQYDAELSSIHTVDAAVTYVRATHPAANQRAIADAIDGFVRRRFFHGYSLFRPCDNWIAYVAGYFWSDLRNPVRPNDILAFRRGACSQQAIVFETMARRMGLDVGSVRMVRHFLPAVKIDGEWRVYDPDQEIQPRSYPLSLMLKGDRRVAAIYRNSLVRPRVEEQAAHGQIHLTNINSDPAPRATLFHRVTYVFSRLGGAFFLTLLLLLNGVRALVASRKSKPADFHLQASIPAE